MRPVRRPWRPSRIAREFWRSWLRIESIRWKMLRRGEPERLVASGIDERLGDDLQSTAPRRTLPPLLEAVIMADDPRGWLEGLKQH